MNIQVSAQSQRFNNQAAIPSLEIHINKLSLHGFSGLDRDRIRLAFQSELVRLLGEQGVPPLLTQNNMISSQDGKSFEIAADTSPKMIGIQIAQSVYRGLGNE